MIDRTFSTNTPKRFFDSSNVPSIEVLENMTEVKKSYQFK